MFGDMIKDPNKYQFYDYSESEIDFEIVFIVGPSRSGKSSLGRLLGSLQHYFHVEENWLLLMLPAMCKEGLLSKDAFINMYRACISELVYDTLLMRTTSFRPTDHSYIYLMKSKEEVDFSLKKLQSRADVNQYLKTNEVTVVLNLSEMNPFIYLLRETYPTVPIIHVVRDPYNIAEDVLNKKWYSDVLLLKPSNRRFFHKYKYNGNHYYIPSWVGKEQATKFIKMSESERAHFYAVEQYYLTSQAIAMMNESPIFVYYEDLVKDPGSCLNALVPGFLEGVKTSELLDELSSRACDDSCSKHFPEVDEKIDFINKYIPYFKDRYCIIKD